MNPSTGGKEGILSDKEIIFCSGMIMRALSIIFGVSNNDSILIDNKYAKHIAYKPKDNGEEFRSLIEKKYGFIDSTDPLVTTHGGYFASSGHFDD